MPADELLPLRASLLDEALEEARLHALWQQRFSIARLHVAPIVEQQETEQRERELWGSASAECLFDDDWDEADR